MSDRRRNPVSALSAFLRVGYLELLTVMVLSVLTALAAIPVVTLGAAIIAGVDTMMAVLGGDGTTPESQLERVRYFSESFADHLLQGVLFGPLLIVVTLLTGSVIRAAFAPGSTATLIAAVLGLYAVILTVVWVFRAASVTLRAPESPGPIGCLGEALVDLAGDVAWTSLHALYAATFWLALVWTRIGVVLLLPGLLVVLEIVTYEERHGAGAEALAGSETVDTEA